MPDVQDNGIVIGTVAPRESQTDTYEQTCLNCRSITLVDGIVDLLVVHTSARGRFRSPCCAGAYATGRRVGDSYEGNLIGAFMIDSGIETGFPIGFVLASTDEDARPTLVFELASDYRREICERLRKGHPPAGPLTTPSANPRSIVKHLREVGLLPEGDRAAEAEPDSSAARRVV